METKVCDVCKRMLPITAYDCHVMCNPDDACRECVAEYERIEADAEKKATEWKRQAAERRAIDEHELGQFDGRKE